MEQGVQADFAVVHHRMAPAQEVGLRGFVARAVAKLAVKTALAAAATIGSRFQVEESRRVEIIGLLPAAPDIPHGRGHPEKQEQHRGDPATSTLRDHGSTS
jgi:hypothetical protein